MSRGVQVRVLFWALTAQVVKLVYTLLWGGSGRKIVWVRVSSCAHLLYGEKSETVFLLFLCGFLWDCSQEEYVCSWEKCVLSEKNRMRTVEEQYCDGRMWSGFDWNNHLLITYWLPTDHLLITYKNTEKICTDHTDYTDADERRELYGSHGKTRMQMNRDSVTLRENPCSSKNIRSIR